MPKPTLAQTARRMIGDGQKLLEFLQKLADGEIEGATPKDRLQAARELLDRGYGRATETVINVESEENPLADVPAEELKAVIKKIGGGKK